MAQAADEASGVMAGFGPPPPMDPPTGPEEIVAWLFDADRRGELYPLYHELRRRAPVHRTADPHLPGVWLLSRFQDALSIYRNPRAVSDPATAEHFNHAGQSGPFYQMLRKMMLFLESDAHLRVRRIATRAFTPRSIAAVRPVTQAIADRLLDEVAPQGQMDVVEEFAAKLPVAVISRLLGVPEADLPLIGQYAADFARGSEMSLVETERTRRADAAAPGFRDYFEHLIRRRRQDPGDDVLSALIAAEDAGDRLDHDEVVATSVLLLQAGHETTTDSIGTPS